MLTMLTYALAHAHAHPLSLNPGCDTGSISVALHPTSAPRRSPEGCLIPRSDTRDQYFITRLAMLFVHHISIHRRRIARLPHRSGLECSPDGFARTISHHRLAPSAPARPATSVRAYEHREIGHACSRLSLGLSRRHVLPTSGLLGSRHGCAVATGYDPLLDTEPELARTMAASVQPRIAFGERAGEQVCRLGSGFGYAGERPALTGPRCASATAFPCMPTR
jgi:hypothetical protein